MKRLFDIYLIFFLIFPLAGMGQSFQYDTNPKGVRLPVQNIFQVEQDTLGRIWFSTTRGVFFSDGIQTYSLPDSLNAKFDYQIALHIDEDGSVWLYNDRGQMRFFKGGYGTWEEVFFTEIDNSPQFSFIQFLSRGKGSDKEFVINTSEGLNYSREEGRFIMLSDPDKINSKLSFLGGTAVSPVFYFLGKEPLVLSGGEWKPYPLKGLPLPSPPAMVMENPATGEFYFLGNGYLASGPYENQPEKLVDRDFTYPYPYDTDLYGLSFHSGSVFYHFNSSLRKRRLGASRSLIIDSQDIFGVFLLQDFLIDQEGLLWLASSRGLANINNLAIQNYTKSYSGLLANEVTAITLLPTGEYLLGFNNGIQKFSRSGIETLYEYPSPEGIPTSRIVNFSTDSKNSVWFSATLNGLGRYDLNTGEIEIFPAPEGDNVSSVQVEGDSLIITSSKNIFFAKITDRGEALFKNGLERQINEIFEKGFYHLRKAKKLRDGKLMVMRAGRLENPDPLIQKPGLCIAEGYDFLETPDGILLGTESGLKMIQGESVVPFFPAGRTIKNPVFSILQDSKGALWFGTDDGFYKYEKDSLVHFTEKLGLPNNETNRGALIEGNDQRIMIGTIEGLSIYFQEEKFIASGKPKISINGINAGSSAITWEKTVEIPFEENSLEVDFSAIGFNREKELWVHYRLLGFDGSWKILKNPQSNQIFYPNLPPGDYQFEIKSSYENYRMTETISTAEMRILQPFYFRFWFLALVSLFLIGVGFLVSSFSSQLRKLGILESAVDKKEKEKIRAEEQFKNVWDSSKDALVLTLDGQEIVAVNPVFEKWSLQKEGNLLGQVLHDAINDSVFFKSYMQELEANNLPGFSFSCQVFWPLGKMENEVYTKEIPSQFEGKRLLLTVFRDVTVEKEIEHKLREAKDRAEEANRFKTSLLSNVSHEIRTPLNVILGGTEHVMMTRKNDSKLLSELEIILQSGERLLSTINSILDMAKIEAKKLEIVKQQTDVIAFIKKIVYPLSSLAEKKGLILEENYPKTEVQGFIDQRFTTIILNNLIGNAIKYSEKGRIQVGVSQEDDWLNILVKDEGIGISPEFLEKVFDPFEQESTGNGRKFDGTGLGMTITHSLVKMLEGKIQIDSEKGKGTTVIVQIPLSEI
ncbi:ATP-binding protein [Algoriphagus sp. NF]|uniref:ATP-binding protein n=1 Tax=Algoriphagus sp. NF TaxID=2992756 RepID=UPI00237AFCEF|nr:ATP-binding protein [Algoriphagus sp. NF]MDE0559087.1 ATP-binding protein [Algoriphagus sp. NF]